MTLSAQISKNKQVLLFRRMTIYSADRQYCQKEDYLRKDNLGQGRITQ